MGVTFLWLALRIPPEFTSRVAARFAEAVTASPVSAIARRVLKRWREEPHSLSPECVPDPAPMYPGGLMESEGTVDFEELFRPEALIELGQGFFMIGGEGMEWGIEPPHDSTSVVLTDRIPASAALFFGLGAERAARLPGHFGAFFVAPGDVGQVLPVAEEVLERPSQEMLARARRWLDRGNNEFTQPEDLFAFIPRALRIAHAQREGLLVLTARA